MLLVLNNFIKESAYNENVVYMLECQQVVEQENAFAREEFPDRVTPSPLAGGNDVTVSCVLADDVRPMSVLRTHHRRRTT